MKKFLLILFFIFLISCTYAKNLGISPSEINFNGETNQKICKNISINSNNSLLIGEDRWAIKEFKENIFNQHILKSSDLNLKLYYPENIFVKYEEKIEICLEGKEEGFYHGLLLYKPEKTNAGVGIWLNVNLTKNNQILPTSFITGAIIGDKKSSGNFLIILLPTLLIIVLFLLLKIEKKKKTYILN